jgi:hypothetical protein
VRTDSPRTIAFRILDRVARHRWAWVSGWLSVFTAGALALQTDDGDWGFFRRGVGGLLGQPWAGHPTGIHLFAVEPNLQIGPPALVAALPFHVVPAPYDVLAARLVMSAALLAVLWTADRLAAHFDVAVLLRHRITVLAGLFIAPIWISLAVDYAHLDDVMVVVCALSATLYTATGRRYLAALLIATAAAAKPWGILIAPLLLAGGWRAAVRPAMLAAGVAIAWWAPFLLDPQTVTHLWHFRIDVSASSGLTLLGVHAGAAMPLWVRPAQLVVGIGVGALEVRRANWPAAVLVAFAVRVALDPGAFTYYSAPVVAAALLCDLRGNRSGIPWRACTSAWCFGVAALLPEGPIAAVARVAICAVLVASVLIQSAPVAIERVPSAIQFDHEPTYRAGVGRPARVIANAVCAALTPLPQ